MAKWVIFQNSILFKLASTDGIKDDFVVKGGDNTVAKTISDSQWNDISWDQKDVALVNDAVSLTDKTTNTVSWGDKPSDITYSTESEYEDAVKTEYFQNSINEQIRLVEDFLENNTDAEWTSYLNNLKSINVSSVSLPVDNFQKWFNSQSGFSSKSILELP